MKTGLSCSWLFTILISALIAVGYARQSSLPNSNANPVWQRIADRSFPSVFQAWNQAENLKEDPEMTIARHDALDGDHSA
jgi:hypothetical protein